MTVIKKIRKQKGMSQADLARFANLFPSFVSKLESGKEKAGVKVQTRVEEALSTPREGLFDDNGWPLDTEVTADA